MKQLMIIWGLVIIGLNAIGQNFYPVIENNTSFFENEEREIYAIKINERTEVTDTVKYKLNSVWNFDDFSCIKPNGIAWHGNECLIISANIFNFLNEQKDTIQILPTENIGAKWIAYKFENKDYIQATISNIEQRSVLGALDNIKTIIFQRFDSDGNPITDPVNNATIEISENHGFTKTLDFKSFPNNIYEKYITGMTNPLLGKTFLSEKEIYSFDIGDEFHYDIAYSNPPNGMGRFSKVIKQVLNKTISGDGNSFTYSIRVVKEVDVHDWATKNQTHTISVDTITDTHTFAKQQLYAPHEPIITENYSYSSYNLHRDRNNRLTLTPSLNMLSFYDNCWAYIFYDPPQYTTYKEGCGLFESDADNFPYLSHETMVYYKKGTEIFGTPYNISTSIENIKVEKLNVYPNPLYNDGILNIRLNENNIEKIRVFDQQGYLIIAAENINSSIYTLNLNEISNGLYIVEIIDDKMSVLRRKIVKLQ